MIFFLHGMLGSGDDLQCSGPGQVQRVDLWKNVRPYRDWARDFNRQAQRVPITENPRILVGYSMGGRLALHALLEPGGLWDGAVIVSAHPGLSSAKERNARLLADAEWAERARSMPPEDFLHRWNEQAVFDGAIPPYRSGFETHREAIARAFEIWSLGRQKPLQEPIEKSTCPILWITGERDKKFQELAIGIDVEQDVAPGSGHRVPLENPDWLEQRILDFSQELANCPE